MSDRRGKAAGVPSATRRTIGQAIRCEGIGLHTGQPVAMTLLPAAPGTGIVFRRTDIEGDAGILPARWDRVTQTMHATLLSNPAGTTLSTVEHVMAALAGLGIDDILIAVDGPELPIMDGSSEPFVFLLESAGLHDSELPRRYLRVRRTVSITEGSKSASLSPADHFSVSVEIDFGNNAVARQSGAVVVDETSFKGQISRARTFGFLEEVNYLRANGLALGGSLDNAVVVSGQSVMNPEGLRFDDEFVRHKILDCIGDLYLAGGPILGAFHGVKSGHALNNKLLRAVFADPANYEWVEASASVSTGAPMDLPAVAARA